MPNLMNMDILFLTQPANYGSALQRVSIGISMIFDPIINSALDSDEIIIDQNSYCQPLICAHCNQPIKGKYFQSGKNYYDGWCWQFRFVVDPLYMERASRKTIKQFDEDGNEI